MPQISLPYAVARVTGKSRSMLSGEALHRVAEASTPEEAAKLLTDAGYCEALTRAEAEAQAEQHVLNACKLIREVTPESDVTDCFLLKYDILNLKTLVKSRSLGIDVDDGALSPCGLIDPGALRHAVIEGNYQKLPQELKRTMQELDKRNATRFDPLMVEAELDKAMYRMINERLKGTRDRLVIEYFQDGADLTNLMIALRSNAMGRGAQFAAPLLVDGGALGKKALLKAADDAQEAPKMIVSGRYSRMVRPAVEAYAQGGTLAAVEKQIDDYKIRMVRGHRFEIDSILPLIGYLVAREREAAVVRLLMTAKAQRLSGEKLLERLRELYV